MPFVSDSGRQPTFPRDSTAKEREANLASSGLTLSEQRQRQMIEALPAAAYTCDRDGRITWCNEAAAELWGRRPEIGVERWGGSVRVYAADGTLLPSSEFPSARALREEKSIRNEEIIIERPDGTRRHVIANPQLMRDETGEVTGIVNLLLDVTEARRAELDVRRLAAIVESSDDAILGTDLDGTITSWNGGAERLYGFAVTETLGRSVTMIVPAELLEDEREILQRVRRGEKIAPFDTVRRCKDGRLIDVSLTVSPIKDARGRIIGASKTARDITAQRRAMRALAESEERLRLATRTGKVGLWEWDIDANRVTWTDSLYEIHGVARETFDATVEGFAALIHPEDRAPVERALQSTLKHDVPYELEFRAVRPGGGIVWLFTNAVVQREAGRPRRLLGATFDVTARKVAELALRDSEKRFRTLTSYAPVGIFLTDAQGETIFVNEFWSTMSGFPVSQARGDGWTRAMHPDDRARVAAEWEAARREQRASQAEYRFLREDGTVTWVHGNAVPLRDEAGRLAGYIGTIADITQRKLAEEKLRAQQAQLRLISTNAPISLAHCSRDGRFLFVNRANAQRFGLEPEQMIGRTLVEVMGSEAVATIQPYVERALKGESIDYELEVPYKGIGTRFMRVSYVPDFAEDGSVRGWMSALSDMTDRRQMENALRESESRFRQLADSMPQIVFAADAKGTTDYYNRRWYEFTGADEGGTGDESFLPILHPDDRQRCLDLWYRCVSSGKPYQIEYRFFFRARNEYRWQLGRALPVHDTGGRITRWFGTCTDIHDWKLVQEELGRRTATLETLNRIGRQLAAERDIEKVVQEVTDAGRELSGAALGAFFYNVKNDVGGAYTLYTLSGLPRDAFAEFPMPRATSLFGPAFRGESVLRIADVTKDERYGQSAPHFGLPKGHPPVRSFLAVPVTSRTGDVLGGLFFGHPEPDRFTGESEQTVSNLAAQAAIAIDNANLYQALSRELREKSAAEEELRIAQEQLRAHAIDLEKKIEERTASLREAIVQMEEFSYSVSHDLRAPLRAMNAYAEALVEDYGSRLDDTAKNYLERIRRSSQRMENLTHDLLAYSRVARSEVELRDVDLEPLLRDLIAQYSELQPAVADVRIETPLLPVRGHESSLGQCLANLMTNAVKFVAPGVRPQITVRTEASGDRVRIWIEDNGIGIAPEYQEGLFRVFERVPTNQSYEGTGIGLAIVRKAAEKMGGRCGVESDGRNGSRFWIELPKA
jgi:PAS domain S-box-containing protein